MSEMHAETANWIDGLRARADGCEQRIAADPEGRKRTVDAHDRLHDLRLRLDKAEQDHAGRDSHRTSLESMYDDIDAAVSRALVRM